MSWVLAVQESLLHHCPWKSWPHTPERFSHPSTWVWESWTQWHAPRRACLPEGSSHSDPDQPAQLLPWPTSMTFLHSVIRSSQAPCDEPRNINNVLKETFKIASHSAIYSKRPHTFTCGLNFSVMCNFRLGNVEIKRILQEWDEGREENHNKEKNPNN